MWLEGLLFGLQLFLEEEFLLQVSPCQRYRCARDLMQQIDDLDEKKHRVCNAWVCLECFCLNKDYSHHKFWV